jgi:AbrB family looped-hinge helix DNA binding protein
MNHLPELLGMATLNEKGQVVIPAKVRSFFDLKPGDKLLIISDMHKSGLMLIKSSSLAAVAKKLDAQIANLQSILKQRESKMNE